MLDLSELRGKLVETNRPVHRPTGRMRLQIAAQKWQHCAAPHRRCAAKTTAATLRCALVGQSTENDVIQRMRIRARFFGSAFDDDRPYSFLLEPRSHEQSGDARADN